MKRKKNVEAEIKEIRNKLLGLSELLKIDLTDGELKNSPFLREDFVMEFFIEHIYDDNSTFLDTILNASNILGWKPSKREIEILEAIDMSYLSVYTSVEKKPNITVLADDLAGYILECEGDVLRPTFVGLIRIIELDNKLYRFSGPYIISSEDEFEFLVENFSIDDSIDDDPEVILKIQSSSLLSTFAKGAFFEEPEMAKLYGELQDFEDQLDFSEMYKKTLSFSLIEFYDHQLEDKGLSLRDIDQINFKAFFVEALSTEMIRTKDELNNFIDALKYYTEYLSGIDEKYAKKYQELVDISENRFIMMERAKLLNNLFPLDISFQKNLEPIADLRYFGLVGDFDEFIVYVTKNDIELTDTNNLKRKEVKEINYLITYQKTGNIGRGNQSDFPIIDFLVKFGLEYSILERRGNFLKSTNLSVNWLRLNQLQKLYVLANYLIRGGYWETLKYKKDKEFFSDIHMTLIDFLNNYPKGDYLIKDIFGEVESLGSLQDVVILYEAVGLVSSSINEKRNLILISDEFTKKMLNHFSADKIKKAKIVPIRQ